MDYTYTYYGITCVSTLLFLVKLQLLSLVTQIKVSVLLNKRNINKRNIYIC